MYNSHFPFSLLSFCSGTVAVLAVSYIGLIAVVMSYAALTVEFSQSVRNDEAVVAILEKQYITTMTHITGTNYTAMGYAKPLVEVFVLAKNVATLR